MNLLAAPYQKLQIRRAHESCNRVPSLSVGSIALCACRRVLLANAIRGIVIMLLTAFATSSASACTATSAAPSVTICEPASSSTTTSPVNVQAAAASKTAVTKFLLYIDNVLVYQAPDATSVNANLTVAAGTHNLVAQFYNGTWVKQSEDFTVSASPPAVAVSISPTSVSMMPDATQQFTAAVQNTSNAAVSWSVSGVPTGDSTVGTITGSTLSAIYTAPSVTGPQTVTATSVADSTKSATAAVNVTTAPNGFPASSHVFVLMEENQGFAQVFPSGGATNCNSAGMPYLCTLAAANGLALNFYANLHGSLRGYLYITSGSGWTPAPDDCGGGGCAKIGVITADNLVRALTAAGKSWRGYFEGMPSPGYMGGDTGGYLLHHNPFPWYSDVADSSSQQKNMLPFTQLAADEQANSFQNFSLIIPNEFDDADAPDESSSVLLATADNWLKKNLAPLLATPTFQPGGDGILIIVFDEGEVAGESGGTKTDDSCSPTQSSGCGGHIAFVMIGPQVIPHSTTSTTYQFQDALHTIIHLLGLTDYMNGATGGKDINLLPGVNE